MRYVTLRSDLSPPHAAICVQASVDAALVALDIGIDPFETDPAQSIKSLDLSRHTPAVTGATGALACWICNGYCVRTPVGDPVHALGFVKDYGVSVAGEPVQGYAYLESL